MPATILPAVVKVFDCGHGRLVRVHVPESRAVAFVAFSDPDRTHDLLAWRDSPGITLSCEGTLVGDCLSVAAGTLKPSDLADCLLSRHPRLQHSEWRRSLVRDFLSVAAPYDPDRAIREAMGHDD